MAQIRSKQIADFLASVDWNSVNTTDIANAQDVLGLVSDKVSTEASVRLDADQTLSENLSTEVVDRTNAVSAEASTRLANDNTISANLSTEASTRLANDNTISANLSTELVARANAVSAEASTRLEEDEAISAGLSTEVVDRTNAVSAEASARIAGDGALSNEFSTDLSTEASVREAADVALGIRIDQALSNIDPAALDSLTEVVSAFQNADGDLTALISDVLSEHDDEYEGLSDVVSTEIVDRTNAVSAEASLRVSADNVISGNLSTEVVDRTNAVSTEASLRVSADNVISGNLSTEVVDRTNAVSAEAYLRISGDASLDAKIDSGTLYFTETVDNLDFAAIDLKPFTTIKEFRTGAYDVNVFVNGVAVDFVQNSSTEFELVVDYFIEATDKIKVIGVQG